MGGRTRTVLETIPPGKKRSAAFRKRKIGLLKKSIELSVLCDAEVILLVRNKDKWTQFASHDVQETWQRFSAFHGSREVVTVMDHGLLESGKCLPTSTKQTLSAIGDPQVNDDDESDDAGSVMLSNVIQQQHVQQRQHQGRTPHAPQPHHLHPVMPAGIVIPRSMSAPRMTPLSEMASPWELSDNDDSFDVFRVGQQAQAPPTMDSTWQQVFIRQNV
ncbi:MADS-box domain-containing protein [Plasmodiophora brassicae]|uniref:MADS-box domain-containing protein n=1 Tax=Plasmodiophora brassicae TaxID=37360 RepID=A0A0G4INR3_PLABS|nr:hypothetical protein PBRA_005485 [Plasmodiophora brassicae]